MLQRAEIGQIGVDAAARGLYLTGDCLSTLGIATVHQHVQAPLGERTCDRPAKAAGSSRDQGDSAVLHHFPSRSTIGAIIAPTASAAGGGRNP